MSSASDTAWDKLGAWKNGFNTVQEWARCVCQRVHRHPFMNGYEDPRREVYFKTTNNGTGAAYTGVRSGIAGITTADYANAEIQGR